MGKIDPLRLIIQATPSSFCYEKWTAKF